jgi:hypothetical protein
MSSCGRADGPAARNGTRRLIRASTLALGLMTASMVSAGAEETQLSLPDISVMAPGPTDAPPYLRDQWNATGRNPYPGRDRVEEDKFTRVPCSDTRVVAISGGTCLQGYRFDTGPIPAPRPCDMALDVTLFENARISVEVDMLVFDPYKVTALGGMSSRCYVRGFLGYGVADFADMNQVTRRGVNFRNLVGAGDDKAIEFDVDGHHCKAIRRTGPRWQGGYVYIGHVSICRTDAAQVQADDVAYVFNTLRVRIYDPHGNLRGEGSGGVGPPPVSTPGATPGPR